MDPFQTWVTGIDPNQVGLGAIVTAIIVSILRGWIVPRSVYQDRIDDKDKQLAAASKERDDWKEAFHKCEEGRAELTNQNSDLIKGADTANRLMDALREQIERNAPTQRKIES